MLWKTHLRISFEVLRRLGLESLPHEVTQSFKTGILTPDQLKDYPHHYGKSESIKEHLLRSRGYFLKEDWPNAFFFLGVALHYIQDSYTSMPSDHTGHHHNWEVSIDYANFTGDLRETITHSLGNNAYERDRCLKIADILSEKALGRDNTLYVATLSGQAASKSLVEPIVDLNLALRASYVVTESVLSSKNCFALETKLRNVLSNYKALMRTADEELSNKIITLAYERDELRKRKASQSGIVSKMRNWVLGIRIGLKDSAIKSNTNYYLQKKHLEKVAKEYMKAANMMVAPCSGWYDFQIPRINPEVVSMELPPVLTTITSTTCAT